MTISLSTVIVLGACAVVMFDLVASLAARHFGFAYARATIGSYALYFAIGFFAAKASPLNAIDGAAAAGAVAGFVDASAGWLVSWQVGPGRLPSGARLTATQWLRVAIIVTAVAAAIGAIGGIGPMWVFPDRAAH
jgi:hypothetical protein